MNPYWLEEEAPERRQVVLDGRVDVAIVGAGVTGCSAALRLVESGLHVRVYDQRGVAEGASGRNGGFALRGAASRYDVARETYGATQAAAYWRWTEEALDRVAELAGDALRRPGGYRLAADEEERADIRLEYEALREDGFEVEWLDDVTALDAEQVLVATDGYGHGLVPELADSIWPTRGQVIVSEPLDRVLYDRPHYARQGFDYWQQLPDRRVLLGGFRDVSILDELTDVEEMTSTIQDSLESFLGELIGETPRISHRWAGIFGLTQDMLPLVGRVPGRDSIWVAGGYSGHGNVLGFACGELVADAILGDSSSPQLALFDPSRLS